MTEIRYICDGLECYKANDYDEIWEIDEEVAEEIIKFGFCNAGANSNDLHLCKECMNELAEYPDKFKIEDEMLCLKGEENERNKI